MDADDLIQIPSVCGPCGTTFGSGIALGPGTVGVTSTSNRGGTCPRCGRLGSVPDGVYSFASLVENAARDTSTVSLQRILAAVTELQGQVASGQQVADELEKAGGRWRQVADYIRPRSGGDLVGYVAFLITLIQGILG